MANEQLEARNRLNHFGRTVTTFKWYLALIVRGMPDHFTYEFGEIRYDPFQQAVNLSAGINRHGI